MSEIVPITKYRTPDGVEHHSEEKARQHMTAVTVLRALKVSTEAGGHRYRILIDIQEAGFTIHDERPKAA